VLRIDPNYVPALNNLGVLALRQGRPDEALAFLRRAVAVDPGNERARANLQLAVSRGDARGAR